MTENTRQRTDFGIRTGWKRRCPGLERGLTITAACFVLFSVAPAVSFAIVVTNSSSCHDTGCAATGVGGGKERNQEVRNVSGHGGKENTCFTAACNDTATMIMNNMDRSVEPCDNFYRYACGGYLNSTKIPDNERSVSYLTSTQDKLDEQLRAIVEAEIDPNEPRTYRLAKQYYKSCMNESAIEARGVQPLLASLRRIGGWPMIEGASWNEGNFDWTKAIYELRKSGHPFQAIVNIKVAVNKLNRTEHAIYISPPIPSILYIDPNEYVKKTMRPNVDNILDVAVSLGARNNTRTEEELRETLKFELNLMTIPQSELTLSNAAATPMTLAELEKNYPSIPWQEYIRKMLPSTVSVAKNQVMIVETPIYFTRLDKLMSNTSKRVLDNYIAQTIVLNSIKYLNKEMIEKQRQLLADLGEHTIAQPRWKICIEDVSSLPFALESMYMRRHLSADTKSNVASLMEDIQKAVRKMLERQTWLDEITKSRALQKFDALYAYIADADELSDDKLDKIFENLEMDEENYYKNIHDVSLFNMEYSLGKLGQPVDKGSLIEGIKITQAMATYSTHKNSFALTAGMLQDNFFSNDRPRYMNYGAIGTIIGHGIIHAFDDVGRHFNEEGEIIDWWQPSSENEFFRRVQCLVDQYSNYTVREVGLHVDGVLTVNENIADNGGTKGAYLAYNDWVAKNGEEPKLPGIDMTPHQLFWISTATSLCTKYPPNELINRIYGDIHSPNEFRTVGPMSNIPEFAEDFRCPLGSNMNPREKCLVW